MEVNTQKTVDMLTKDGVSILTQNFIEFEGKKQQVGEKHRRAYSNSRSGRDDLIKNEPSDVIDAVWAIWGSEPTVEDPEEPSFDNGASTDDSL